MHLISSNDSQKKLIFLKKRFYAFNTRYKIHIFVHT